MWCVEGKGTNDAVYLQRTLTQLLIKVNKDGQLCITKYKNAFDSKQVNMIKMTADL